MRLLIAALCIGLAGLASIDPAQVARGQQVFQKCYACHSVDPAETRLPGPNLAGVVGRAAASERGFDYSPAMRMAARRGLIWNAAKLDAYLADPQRIAPGTSMNFVGLRDPAERAAVIAYLMAHSARR